MQRHKIGTYAGGVAGMNSICDLLQIGIDPDSKFREYAEVVGTDLTGAPVEAGFPTATWTWDVMPQADFDRLLGLVSNGASAQVTIRTRNNSGASGFDFDNYTAVMQRPKAGIRDGLVLRNVTVDFSMLVAV